MAASKQEVIAYIENNWDSDDNAIVVMKKAFNARNDTAFIKAVKSIVDAILGIGTTPAKVIADVVAAIKEFFGW